MLLPPGYHLVGLGWQVLGSLPTPNVIYPGSIWWCWQGHMSDNGQNGPWWYTSYKRMQEVCRRYVKGMLKVCICSDIFKYSDILSFEAMDFSRRKATLRSTARSSSKGVSRVLGLASGMAQPFQWTDGLATLCI